MWKGKSICEHMWKGKSICEHMWKGKSICEQYVKERKGKNICEQKGKSQERTEKRYVKDRGWYDSSSNNSV
jgi:hypothetical protein